MSAVESLQMTEDRNIVKHAVGIVMENSLLCGMLTNEYNLFYINFYSCAQGFGGETWGKETIGETKT